MNRCRVTLTSTRLAGYSTRVEWPRIRVNSAAARFLSVTGRVGLHDGKILLEIVLWEDSNKESDTGLPGPNPKNTIQQAQKR